MQGNELRGDVHLAAGNEGSGRAIVYIAGFSRLVVLSDSGEMATPHSHTQARRRVILGISSVLRL